MAAPASPEPAVLAFDGGSTKTDAALVAGDGTVLARARVGPSNHQLVGIDEAVRTLAEVAETLRTTAHLASPETGGAATFADVAVFCLAGIDLDVDEARMVPALEALRVASRVLVRNDTFAVSRAGTSAPWGIGVVCGTGMNCAAVGPDGRTVRFPALAELSGDFAPGGSWLGVRALGLALRAGDGRGGPTSLRERVADHFGVADPEAVLTGVYTGSIPYPRLFELARVCVDAAADGDGLARSAVDELADEVVAFVRAAVERLDLHDEPVEVVLGGGIFETTDEGLLARVSSGIHASAPRAALVRLDAPPLLGAALLGLDALGSSEEARRTLRTQLTRPDG